MTKQDVQVRKAAVERRRTTSFSNVDIAMDQLIVSCDSLCRTLDESDGVPIETTAPGESDSLVTVIEDTRIKVSAAG